MLLIVQLVFAWTQVQINDGTSANNIVSQYNRIASGKAMNAASSVASEPKNAYGNAKYDGYVSKCNNGDLLLFQVTKTGQIIGCMLTGSNRNNVIKETLMIVSVITNHEKLSPNGHNALVKSFKTGKYSIWYSARMNRYYGIDVDNEGNTCKALIVACAK